MKTIEVRAAYCMNDLESGRIASERVGFDTVSEATKYAKRCLSVQFQASEELSRPLGYSVVIVNGARHSDFFCLR